MRAPRKPALVTAYGLATTAYGASVLIEPRHMLRAARTDRLDHRTARRAARAIGARDVVSGLSILAAGSDAALGRALAARAALDFSDAASFSAATSHAPTRAKILAVTGLWGGLALLLRRHARGRA
jgi:hypothetical protein